MDKKEQGHSWRKLQSLLRQATSGEEVIALLHEEKEGLNRHAWIVRITGRYKELRRLHEERRGITVGFK